MLRSSSTPVLGSLLSSFSDSPSNNINHHHYEPYNSTFKHQNSLNNRLPLYQHNVCNTKLNRVSCNSSPISPSIENHYKGGVRRAESDGNLQGLAYASCSNNEENYYSNVNQTWKFSGRSKCLMLETIPSSSFYNSRLHHEEDDEEEDDVGYENEEEFDVGVIEGTQLDLSNKMGNMVLKEAGAKGRVLDTEFGEERELISEQMYLTRGIGIDDGLSYNENGGGDSGGDRGGRGGRDDEFSSTGGDGGDIHRTEEYYKKIIQEEPGNPLFLRNYAQFLHQTKKDHKGAEEFYSRAVLADPKDGEVLSQYAKLVWEIHRDEVRASSYHECAVQASPENSHIHAAYASFLWEVEEEENECQVPKEFDVASPNFHGGAMASASA